MTVKRWPCRSCGILLGICHLLIGTFLLIFDIITNAGSQTVFGIIAAILFILCALFAFISARRLDKTAQLLLGIFATFAFLISLCMMLHSALAVNSKSDLLLGRRDIDKSTDSGTDWSPTSVYFIYTVLLCIGLTEVTLSLATIIVCYRSFNETYMIETPESPYSILVGNSKSLPK
uniref:MARVEL domain-containing protein n=1 Tax=Syphacia muris TaxID=451379 RepID=A0A0N5A9T7_9BILA